MRAVLIKGISSYLSLIKFSHTVFAMPFALIGFFLGLLHSGSHFTWTLMALVVLCMVFARSAAMAFNRYVDRGFDSLNPRTSGRELVTGKVSKEAAMFFVILTSLMFIITTWFINKICFFLSPVALLVILGYSYTKRFTYLCHLVLGLGLALAPIGAYLAVVGEFHIIPVLFSVAVFCWVSGFDIVYALQDEEFDRNLGLHSIPAYIGIAASIRLSRALHAVCFLALVSAGLLENSGLLYFSGVLLFGLALLIQHRLVKHHDLSRINLAFFTTNGIAGVLFSAFVITDMYL